ncbi:MAG: lamin tail domain-containing protein, partial [Planctomycetales bacterium]|nr:lamin tail domain-containing protein [Planctomycetales bacterium]
MRRFRRYHRFRMRKMSLAPELLESRRLLDGTVVWNEIMYHPADGNAAGEWVEIYNALSVDVDLSGWAINGGVEYEFPAGTVIHGRTPLVIAADPAAVELAYGIEGVLGPFLGQLANGGETLELFDHTLRRMSRLEYADTAPWPIGADGSGASLSRIGQFDDVESAASWRASLEIGGTPGAANFPDLDTAPREYRALVQDGVPANVLVPAAEQDRPLDWNSADFDALAAGWTQRETGVGYDTTGLLPSSGAIDPLGDLEAEMLGQNSSALIRTEFTLDDAAAIDQLSLDLQYDDGFVAYLNGAEVARRNAPAGEPLWNAAATEPTFVGYEDATLATFDPMAAAPVGYWRLGESPDDAVAVNRGTAGATLDGVYENHGGSAAGLVDDDDAAVEFNGVQDATGTQVSGDGLNALPAGNPFAGDWTIEAWLVHDAINSWSGIFSNNAGTVGAPLMTFIGTSNSLGINGAGVTANNVAVDLGPDHLGKPVYAVITKTGGNDPEAANLSVYANVDGEWLPVASGTNVGWTLAPADAYFIGRHYGSQHQKFDGRIDEVAVYSRALEPVEIEQHFLAAGHTPTNTVPGGTGQPLAGPARASIDLTPHLNELMAGENVLAIQGLNVGENDPDFLIRPNLTGRLSLSVPSPTRALQFTETFQGAEFYVEIMNTGETPVDLTGVVLQRDGIATGEFALPARVLDSGEFVAYTQTTLGFRPAAGDRLYLLTPDRSELIDALAVGAEGRARSTEYGNAWLAPSMPTPNAPNQFALHDEIVINEISYHGRSQPAIAEVTDQPEFIAFDGTWRYESSNTDQGVAWRDPDFDDQAWQAGSGVLASSDFGDYNQTVLADQPVGYWRLGEAAGVAAAENLGAAGDALDGLYENLEESAAGLVGDSDLAAVFNGLQTVAGTQVSGSGLNALPAGNPFAGDWTIEAWLVHDNVNQWSGVFSNNASSNGSPLLTFIDTTNSLGINGAGVTGANVSVDLGADHFGKPIYAVVTKTGGNGAGEATLTVRVNLDGQWLPVAMGTNGAWALNPGDGYYIGRHYSGAHQKHEGLIDEVAIYDYALSADQIQSHFQSGSLRQQTALPSGVATTYFRSEFDLNYDPAQASALTLDLLVDDGAVVHLNGQEVARVNMPAGAVEFTTSALADTPGPLFVGGIDLPLDALRSGRNVLAVEVHQFHDLTVEPTADVTFAAELTAEVVVQAGQPFEENTLEWLELFNRSNADVDVSGWMLDEAVGFTFPLGTTIPAGEFLVVTNDPVQFAATYPTVAAIGPFNGALANDSDQVVLRDANGNPADEVRYFDDGPWPETADGFGATLELRDPDADNRRAEAWQASDEAAHAEWSTFTFRQTARPDTGPTIWHEFIFGLLDTGQVLIDDVHLVEDPDGAAVELIQNGDFSTGDATSWRVIGNHVSEIVPDPNDPTNSVLQLTASGPTDHQHNHAETTLSGNVAAVNGTQYELSFRARWAAGSNQLNGRIYLSRIAETFLLDVPSSSGTPGAVNSRYNVNIGPTFTALSHVPTVPRSGEDVVVSVAASDAEGVADATLWYRVDGQGWQSTPMTLIEQSRYEGVIPGQAAAAVVQFYVEAVDSLGARAFFPAAGPDSRALLKVHDRQAPAGAVDSFRIVMLNDETEAMFVGTNLMSNQNVGATVVVNDSEVYYDVG